MTSSHPTQRIVFSISFGKANTLLHRSLQGVVGIRLWFDGAFTGLQHKSSKGYELLRKSNCIKLPSQRTLRDYTHFINTTSGFSHELDKQPLIRDSKSSSLKEYQKYVGLLCDEMHVKEGLVYDKNTGELTGYCDLGDINNHLHKLEEEYKMKAAEKKSSLASTVMQIMVRGLFHNLTSHMFAFHHLTSLVNNWFQSSMNPSCE